MFITMLGARVHEGLRISGVPTSRASAALARDAGIPLIELGEAPLDITVDGADEVAPNLDLVKGWGGALVRERIVAAASIRQIILVGRDKLVTGLGERGRVPLEVIPLAERLVMRETKALGLVPTLRMQDDAARPFVIRERKPHHRLRAPRADAGRTRGPRTRAGTSRHRRGRGHGALSRNRGPGPRRPSRRPRRRAVPAARNAPGEVPRPDDPVPVLPAEDADGRGSQ